jgi:hypothetical protein
MKILIFSGTLHFQICRTNLLFMPPLVMNSYKEFVENFLLAASPQQISSSSDVMFTPLSNLCNSDHS